MYINLPSKNHYRRPASYSSKGYHTRRMAVDFAIPLITNVKNAKMLAEALIRKLPLDVSSLDSKTSHRTHSFPGLINIGAFVPDLGTGGKGFAQTTEAAISAGFTTALIVPFGNQTSIVDRQTLDQARSNVAGASCNYAFSVTATAANAGQIDEELQAEAKSLYVPASTPLAVVASHFSAWPTDKVIVTDAKGSELASILLLASLHNRSVHITNVRTTEDLLLISLSKAKQLRVTCDVSVFSLFFTQEQFPGVEVLPTTAVQNTMWQKLDIVDAFSVGHAPYKFATALGKDVSSWSGVSETLPLLLTAVEDGRLTLDDIRVRLHDNPVQIFGLADQVQTSVEVVIGRKAPFVPHAATWSPVGAISGFVHRVIVHNQTIFLDGTIVTANVGRDISGIVVSHLVSTMGPVPREVDIPSHAPLATAGSLTISQEPHPASLSHISAHPAFHRRHILSVKQFTQRDMYDLFSVANEMRLQVERNGTLDVLKGKVLCTLFYEPSTRTSSSFDAAMKRCGGEVVQVTADTSSVVKGETLADTVRTLACYGDAIVLRHPEIGSSQEAAKYSAVPVINAGDGIGEHPTQVHRSYQIVD